MKNKKNREMQARGYGHVTQFSLVKAALRSNYHNSFSTFELLNDKDNEFIISA